MCVCVFVCVCVHGVCACVRMRVCVCVCPRCVCVCDCVCVCVCVCDPSSRSLRSTFIIAKFDGIYSFKKLLKTINVVIHLNRLRVYKKSYNPTQLTASLIVAVIMIALTGKERYTPNLPLFTTCQRFSPLYETTVRRHRHLSQK